MTTQERMRWAGAVCATIVVAAALLAIWDQTSSRPPASRSSETSEIPPVPLFALVEDTGLPLDLATWGGTFADLDGDQRMDLVLNRHRYGPAGFSNRGGLKFEPLDENWRRPEGLKDHHSTAAYDYDNDGDTDLYLTVGARKGRGIGTNQFWICERRGVYRDLASSQSILQNPHGRGRSALWLNLTGAATPTLFVGNFASPSLILELSDGKWARRTDLFENPAWSKKLPPWVNAAAGDLNLDGRVDFVAPRPQGSIFVNDGAGRFVDVSDSVGVQFVVGASAVALGDVDLDGDLDILTTSLSASTLTLWINERSADGWKLLPRPLGKTFGLENLARGCFLADFDNDGVLDLYVLRSGRGDENRPNLIAQGQGDGTFVPRNSEWGAEDDVVFLPHSAWPLDLDFDGDLDLICFQGAKATKKARVTTLLFENRTPHKGITILLRNSDGPAEGLGAIVDVETARGWQRQEVRCVGDPYSSMVAPVHFGGLSPNAEVSVRIHWVNGEVQTLTLPRAGASYLIRQGESSVKRL